MNLVGSYIKAAGVTAPPPPAPILQPVPAPLRQIAPTAPTTAPAVQQSEHLTRAAAIVARPTTTQPATPQSAEAAAASGAPTLLTPVPAAPGESRLSEDLKEARIAWIEGKPRNAPAVWPMFPSKENPTETAATKRAKTAWGMTGIMDAYGSATEGTKGAMLFDAVRAIRDGADDSSYGALGKA